MPEAVATSAAPAAIGPYSQAVKAGGFLFVSGQIPLDPRTGGLVDGDVRAQTRRVLENLGGIIAEAGGSFDRVVKTTVYLVDMADFPAMNEVYAHAFGEHKPARSTMAVAALPRGVRVEIDVVAVVG
jgi:2-iminobutanoate/2-iminopropanoate deaminase